MIECYRRYWGDRWNNEEKNKVSTDIIINTVFNSFYMLRGVKKKRNPKKRDRGNRKERIFWNSEGNKGIL